MAERVDYDKYIMSPEWAYRREERLRFAGHRCELCNVDGRLEVHHRTYERLGSEMLTDLIVLCEVCHGIFHEAGKITGERLGPIERAVKFLYHEVEPNGSEVKALRIKARRIGIREQDLETARLLLGILMVHSDAEKGAEWLWSYGASDEPQGTEPAAPSRPIGDVSDEAIQRMVEKLAHGVPERSE